jgi:hypothetical protein
VTRFWPKVLVPQDGEGYPVLQTCWLWLAGRTNRGYGAFWLDGMSRQAHVVAYELTFGKVPAGLVLDHVKERGCVNRHCVNPYHLEAVTDLENVRRGSARGMPQKCPGGHEWTEENTICRMKEGKPIRICQICLEEWMQTVAYRHRHRS